jgi:hypothetical protein
VSTSSAAMAQQYAAVFRPGLASIYGSIITRASTGVRKEGTSARKSGGAQCCAGHGEPSRGRTPARSRGGGNGNVTLPWLGSLLGADERVERFTTKLVTGLETRWRGTERVRAHWSKGGDGDSVRPPGRGESERGGRGASEGRASASWRP